MKLSEKNEIINWSKTVSDEELEKTYYDTVYNSLGSQTEAMYELGYDMVDIKERAKFENFMKQKCDLLETLCEERGIKLWEHIKQR